MPTICGGRTDFAQDEESEQHRERRLRGLHDPDRRHRDVLLGEHDAAVREHAGEQRQDGHHEPASGAEPEHVGAGDDRRDRAGHEHADRHHARHEVDRADPCHPGPLRRQQVARPECEHTDHQQVTADRRCPAAGSEEQHEHDADDGDRAPSQRPPVRLLLEHQRPEREEHQRGHRADELGVGDARLGDRREEQRDVRPEEQPGDRRCPPRSGGRQRPVPWLPSARR